MLAFAGCVTQPRIDWQSRVGTYTYDQTVLELGPPDTSAKLSDGTMVGQWLTFRSYSYRSHQVLHGSIVQISESPPGPNQYLRLTFGPDGVLKDHKTIYK